MGQSDAAIGTTTLSAPSISTPTVVTREPHGSPRLWHSHQRRRQRRQRLVPNKVLCAVGVRVMVVAVRVFFLLASTITNGVSLYRWETVCRCPGTAREGRFTETDKPNIPTRFGRNGGDDPTENYRTDQIQCGHFFSFAVGWKRYTPFGMPPCRGPNRPRRRL